MGRAERLAAAVLAVAGLAGTAATLAQTPPGSTGGPSVRVPGGAEAPPPVRQWTLAQAQQAFDRADLDGDGQLSRAEAQQLALLPRSFEDLDANKDGFVSREEFQAGLR